MDFDPEPTRILATPSRDLLRAIWPELFAEPTTDHVTELSPEEVAELIGDDLRATAEFPAITDEQQTGP